MAKIILQNPAEASTEQLQKNIENIKSEMPQYERHLAHNKGLVELHKKRLSLMERMSAISDVENTPLNPTYQFQKNPEWLKLHSEILQINSAQERKQVQDEIDKLQGIVDGVQAELDRFNEALPKYEAELAKRGE